MFVSERESFETLRTAMGEPQAKAVDDHVDVKIKKMKESLATKQDIDDLKSDMKDFKLDMRKEFVEFKSGMHQEFTEFKSEIKGDITSLRQEMREQHITFRSDFKVMIEGLKTNIADTKSDILRWMIATILVIMGLSATMLRFFV